MQVFEFHFNPGIKEDATYDSFCYEPENIYERKLGNLYIIGELQNLLPQNTKFLDILSSVIKKEYYSSFQRSPEQSIRESLKQANQFLENLTKEGKVSWLGNLNFTVLSIKPLPPSKDFILNFTKVGNLKIFLLRGGEILDVGENLEFQNESSYSPGTFGNIVTGKLIEGDKIIVLTREISQFFIENDLIENISKLEIVDQKKLNEVLKPKEKELQNLFGICFLAILKRQIPLSKETPQTYTFKIPRISLISDTLLYLLLPFRFIKELLLETKKIPLFIFIKIKALPKIITGRKSLRLKSAQKIIKEEKGEAVGAKIKKKSLFLVLTLILLLSGSYFIFKGEREEPYRKAKQTLEIAQTKIDLSENALVFKNGERANKLLQEAWNNILPLTKTGNPMRKEALNLKQAIEKKLTPLNKLEKIEKPELIFDFSKSKPNLIPQKIIGLKKRIFLFNPFSSNLYELETEKRTNNILKENRNLWLGTIYNGLPLFFSKPNHLIYLKNKKFQEINIKEPYLDFDFDSFSTFRSNIYFLNKKSGEIVKYSSPLTQKSFPEFWIAPKSKKATGAKSIAVDGNVWILTKNGKIDRYYAGIYKQTLDLNIFPFLKNPTKIWTSQNCSNLYLLDPSEKRIIILTKHGKILKQFQSEKFNNLLDFAVSQDKKKIWLLNGLKIYRIKI